MYLTKQQSPCDITIMEVHSLSEGLARIERNGQTYLGVNTKIPPRGFALQKLTGNRRSNGWIVRGDQIEHWSMTGFAEANEVIYVYGPYLEGITLSQAVSLPQEQALEHVRTLGHALIRLNEEEVQPFKVHGESVIFLDDGGILFLPREIAQNMTEHQLISDQLELYEVFNHPDVGADQNQSYVLAVLLYRALTGSFPFHAKSEEELHSRIRDEAFTDAVLRVPEIRKDVSDFISATLSDPAGKNINLKKWCTRLDAFAEEGYFRDISEDEKKELTERAQRRERQVQSKFQRNELIRKHWRTAAVITLIVIVVGSIPGTIIYNQLQPRATAGLPPDEVVRAFYSSIGEFDHMTMEDATVDGAAAGLIREVTNLFVLSRMRMSVEMTTGFIDPQQWIDAERPELEPDVRLYGVSDLRIESLRESEEEFVYRVRYRRWTPSFTGTLEDDPQVAAEQVQNDTESFRRVDRVSLRRDGEDWVIYELEVLEEEPVDAAL
jgi:hypothetical protein